MLVSSSHLVGETHSDQSSPPSVLCTSAEARATGTVVFAVCQLWVGLRMPWELVRHHLGCLPSDSGKDRPVTVPEDSRPALAPLHPLLKLGRCPLWPLWVWAPGPQAVGLGLELHHGLSQPLVPHTGLRLCLWVLLVLLLRRTLADTGMWEGSRRSQVQGQRCLLAGKWAPVWRLSSHATPAHPHGIGVSCDVCPGWSSARTALGSGSWGSWGDSGLREPIFCDTIPGTRVWLPGYS